MKGTHHYEKRYGLLKIQVKHTGDVNDQKWVKLFRIAYISATVALTWDHAMLMTQALIFKYIRCTFVDNIPIGVPLVYEFDDKFNTVSHHYLGNQDVIKAKMQAVANQGSRR